MFFSLDAAHMNLWGGQTLPHYERQSENYLSMYHLNHLYCASNYSVYRLQYENNVWRPGLSP